MLLILHCALALPLRVLCEAVDTTAGAAGERLTQRDVDARYGSVGGAPELSAWRRQRELREVGCTGAYVFKVLSPRHTLTLRPSPQHTLTLAPVLTQGHTLSQVADDIFIDSEDPSVANWCACHTTLPLRCPHAASPSQCQSPEPFPGACGTGCDRGGSCRRMALSKSMQPPSVPSNLSLPFPRHCSRPNPTPA